jgi:hypothetical protein
MLIPFWLVVLPGVLLGPLGCSDIRLTALSIFEPLSQGLVSVSSEVFRLT